jgi:microcystin-dependent protein
MFKRKLINCPGGLNTGFVSNTIGSILTTGENVGINTSSPSTLLHVNGHLQTLSITSSNIQSTNCTITNILSSDLSVDSGTIANISTTNFRGTTLIVTNMSSGSGSISNLISNDSAITNLLVTNISASSTSINNLVANNISSGSNIVGIGIVPVGTILVWPSSNTPTGYVRCTGGAISRETFSALWNVIGTTYGVGDNSTTFNVPNLQNRVPVGFGQGTGLTNRTLNQTGGSNTVTLSESNLPTHSHTGSTDPGGSHSHDTPSINSSSVSFFGNQWSWFSNNQAPGNNLKTGGQTDTFGDHVHTFTTSLEGGSNAHNNLQPYIVLDFIIKH